MPSGTNLKNTLENIVRMAPGKIANHYNVARSASSGMTQFNAFSKRTTTVHVLVLELELLRRPSDLL